MEIQKPRQYPAILVNTYQHQCGRYSKEKIKGFVVQLNIALTPIPDFETFGIHYSIDNAFSNTAI